MNKITEIFNYFVGLTRFKHQYGGIKFEKMLPDFKKTTLDRMLDEHETKMKNFIKINDFDGLITLMHSPFHKTIVERKHVYRPVHDLLSSAVKTGNEDIVKLIIDYIPKYVFSYRKLIDNTLKTKNENIIKLVFELLNKSFITSLPFDLFVKWIDEDYIDEKEIFLDDVGKPRTMKEYIIFDSLYSNNVDIFDFYMTRDPILTKKIFEENIVNIHKMPYEMFMKTHKLMLDYKFEELIKPLKNKFDTFDKISHVYEGRKHLLH